MSITLNGTTGITTPATTLTGPLAGTTGSFTGDVSGATGTFTGNLSSGNFYGTDGAYIEKLAEDISGAQGLTVYTDNYRNSSVSTSGTLSSGIDATAYSGTNSSLTKTAQGGSVVGVSGYALMAPSNGTYTAMQVEVDLALV